MAREMAALQAFAGAPVVRLLDGDAELGVMVLEEVRPGTPLTALNDDEAVIREAVRLMQRIWTPVGPDHGFATVGGLGGGAARRCASSLAGAQGRFRGRWWSGRRGCSSSLRASRRCRVLLHGDMHPRNILASEREPWVAIDPKGVVGDPLYDVACLINAVPPHPDRRLVRQMLMRRVDLLAELLGVSRERIMRWGLCRRGAGRLVGYEDKSEGWRWALTLGGMYG
jgi:streptomycin 6-kinase